MRSIDLYDSDTGESLETIKEADVSDLQTWSEDAWLVYARAKRGPIVQIQYGWTRIHYFYTEPAGREMIREHGNSHEFPTLLAAVDEHAPVD